MTNEIKTEEIVERLRLCSRWNAIDDCDKCLVLRDGENGKGICGDRLMALAAERLEQLNNQHIEHAADTSGSQTAEINIPQILKLANSIPIAKYMGRELYMGYWRHFKGKDYFVMAIAEHTETKEPLVLYKESPFSSKWYARPLTMFMSEVDQEKYPDVKQKYRFERRE